LIIEKNSKPKIVNSKFFGVSSFTAWLTQASDRSLHEPDLNGSRDKQNNSF
jgi:hypothetical protein